MTKTGASFNQLSIMNHSQLLLIMNIFIILIIIAISIITIIMGLWVLILARHQRMRPSQTLGCLLALVRPNEGSPARELFAL